MWKPLTSEELLKIHELILKIQNELNTRLIYISVTSDHGSVYLRLPSLCNPNENTVYMSVRFTSSAGNYLKQYEWLNTDHEITIHAHTVVDLINRLECVYNNLLELPPASNDEEWDENYCLMNRKRK
jgi:hypothetical protein